MSALSRKAIRDLIHVGGQASAICLVIGAGIAMLVMSLSTLESIRWSKDAFYDQYGFADVFAQMKRAPQTVAERIESLPGVARAETRIIYDVTLDVADMVEPAVGRLISIPDGGRPRLNGLHLRRGRWLAPYHRSEVLVAEPFALAHQLNPGDHILAVINGRRQKLKIVGITLSPEYLIQIGAGSLMPDDKRFAVLYMGYEGLAAALDMDGAFNAVSLKLMRGAAEPEVLRRLDEITEPYGGIGAYGRDEQVSHQYISDEIRQLRSMATVAPTIFLSVAAFLLNVVLSRLINTQREQIAALKAFGYSKFEIACHYLQMILMIPIVGAALGTIAGAYMGNGMARMYARFYRFPVFSFQLDPRVVLLAFVVSAAAAIVGTLAAVRRAVNLAPAEAMRPEPPASFRPTIIERTGLGILLPQTVRMILRNLERTPIKAMLSILGISLAVAVLILGGFMLDSLQYLMDFQFRLAQRQDVSVTLVEPRSHRVIHEIAHLPGVRQCQPFRSVPVRFRFGHRHERSSIQGLPNNRLFRLLDDQECEISLPECGLVLSEMLAKQLDARLGDKVTVEILDGDREVRRIPVVSLVAEFSGMNAYMRLDALRDMLREGDTSSGAYLQVDPIHQDDLYRTLKETPQVAGVNIKQAALQSFEDTIAENLLRMRLANISFATIIAFGVVYNSARISLSERSRELSTLRVIGFTRREVSSILLGEMAMLTLTAIPLGMFLGYQFAAIMTLGLQTEIYRIPLVVETWTYAFAATVVIVAAVISGLIVRRRIDHFDLVAVLKSQGLVKRMKKVKSLLRWSAMAIAVSAMAAAIYFAMQPKPIDVDVAPVTRGPLKVTVDEDGQTRIQERYVVSAPLSGRLLRVELEPGDHVLRRESQLAAIRPRDPELLDARELQEADMLVKAREAALDQAQPNLERAKAALDYAETELARQTKLAPKGAAGKDDLDQAKMKYRFRSEDYRSAVYAQHIAKYELELARAALTRTRGNNNGDLSDFEIFSPIDGRVLRVLQESATVVIPGTPLIEVGDPADLEVVVDVLSSDAVQIDAGASVLLERWGGERPLNGKVRLVEPAAFTKISALGVEEQRVNVIIDLVDPVDQRQSLGDGFRVEARIVIWERADVVKIPSGALFREGDKWATFVVQSDGRASLRHVTVGKYNDLEAEVVSGLSTEDTVILHPSDKIQDGTRTVSR